MPAGFGKLYIRLLAGAVALGIIETKYAGWLAHVCWRKFRVRPAHYFPVPGLRLSLGVDRYETYTDTQKMELHIRVPHPYAK